MLCARSRLEGVDGFDFCFRLRMRLCVSGFFRKAIRRIQSYHVMRCSSIKNFLHAHWFDRVYPAKIAVFCFLGVFLKELLQECIPNDLACFPDIFLPICLETGLNHIFNKLF